MSGNPDGPYDYRAEVDDARCHANIPVWTSHWNGSGWSYVPDRAELGSE